LLVCLFVTGKRGSLTV